MSYALTCSFSFLFFYYHTLSLVCARIFLNQYVNERCGKSYKYNLLLVENTGVEPVTSCVQGRRSSQLS